MATNYLMQAANPAGALVTWLAVLPDWTAAHAPALGAGSYSDICVAGGGLDTGAPSTPANAMKMTDGSYVTFSDGSYAVTT